MLLKYIQSDSLFIQISSGCFARRCTLSGDNFYLELAAIYVIVPLCSSHAFYAQECRKAQVTGYRQLWCIFSVEYATNLSLYSVYQYIKICLDWPCKLISKFSLGLMNCYWLQWLAAVCPKIDSYDFAKGPLGTEAEVVWADPLIRYKGDRGVLLIVNGGAATPLNKVD